jgi:asparagine synthase (glutamine-hydrolysing)
MSGIAGIYYPNGQPVNRTHLERMLATLKRRGCDGTRLWSSGQVGLAHAMLRTTPESVHEYQPLADRKTNFVITADARLDNRDELIAALELEGGSFDSVSDSELILEAYSKWGDNCCDKLLGDFAFVIWDRLKQQLFCCRDVFGVKPLYYYDSPELFAFASEIKALLALPQMPRRINEGRIADYLLGDVLEGIDKTSTFYLEIHRFEPAYRMKRGPNGRTLERYWSLDPTKQVHYSCDADYVENFREIFTEAVRCRLRSLLPPASMLSGGLDSSSIVGVARALLLQKGSAPLTTFSGISDDEADCIETRSARDVMSQGNLRAHTVKPRDLENFLDDLSWFTFSHNDEPFDCSMNLIQTLYLFAKREGCNVLLDGVPGDLVTSTGTGYIAHLMRSGKLITAIQEANAYSRHAYNKEYPAWKLLFESAKTAAVPSWVRSLRARLRKLGKTQELSKTIEGSPISMDFATRVDLLDRLQTVRSHSPVFLPRTVTETHMNILNQPYITVGIERYNRVASAYSVEPRQPFLDRRLAEFCVALPWNQKVNDGWPKLILRRAMAGILPESIRWRSERRHLGWIFNATVIRLKLPFLERLILDNSRLLDNYCNMAFLADARLKISTATPANDEKNWGALRVIWDTAVLVAWLQRSLGI